MSQRTHSMRAFLWLALTTAVVGWSLVSASPTKTPENAASATQTPIADIQQLIASSAPPHLISIDHLESLLRRVSEILRPSAFHLTSDETLAALDGLPAAPMPLHVQSSLQQMQPPAPQPFNFYWPMFEYEDVKLDAKSRKMSDIIPPPVPSKDIDLIDYYALKPKKTPKKFHATAKQINVKTLAAVERELSSAPSGDHRKDAYLMHDERNRINFDDSFFGVDMPVRQLDNEPHKESVEGQRRVVISLPGSGGEFLNNGEEMPEEDLMATSAMQVPRVSYVYKTPPRA